MTQVNNISIQSVGTLPGVYGSIDVNQVIPISTPLGLVTQTSVSTNTSVTVPTGTTTVTIIPPTANTNALTLKGVSGDTGILLNLTRPTQLSLASGQSAIVLNAASATTITFVWN